MVKLNKAYRNNACFQELMEMVQFYDCISDASFSFIQAGTKRLINYECYMLMAIKGTIDSIKLLLQTGRVNDAFVLVRKFYDDILTQIYISVIHKEKFDVFDNFFVEEVNQWLESSYRIPKITKIEQKLKSSSYTKELYPFFEWKSNLYNYRRFLDDCVHANTYSCVLLNCNIPCYQGVRCEEQLDKLLLMMNQFVKVHVAFIFYLSPEYMMSSDKVECLDMGMTPPEGSENFIAPFAQEAFDKYIKPDAKLAFFIRSHCPLNIT